jgi:hypothetical protein
MKKLSLLIILCILAVGIAANANIQNSDTAYDEANSLHIQSTIAADPITPEDTANPATVSILLGVGIVGFVTFSRRN